MDHTEVENTAVEEEVEMVAEKKEGVEMVAVEISTSEMEAVDTGAVERPEI